MAEVTIFVDDAIPGTLPDLCVKEGIPTDDRLTVRQALQNSTGLGVAWLLVLAGPLGWLGLFVISFTRRPSEMMSAKLPFSEIAYRRFRVAARMRTTWSAVAFGAFVVVVAALAWQTTTGYVVAAAVGTFTLYAVVMTVIESQHVRDARVTLSLDASRRWLTISGAHPDFARAVLEQELEREQQEGRRR